MHQIDRLPTGFPTQRPKLIAMLDYSSLNQRQTRPEDRSRTSDSDHVVPRTGSVVEYIMERNYTASEWDL